MLSGGPCSSTITQIVQIPRIASSRLIYHLLISSGILLTTCELARRFALRSCNEAYLVLVGWIMLFPLVASVGLVVCISLAPLAVYLTIPLAVSSICTALLLRAWTGSTIPMIACAASYTLIITVPFFGSEFGESPAAIALWATAVVTSLSIWSFGAQKASRSARPNDCTHCGYSTLGLEANRCPECGKIARPGGTDGK